ncbi:DUF551 domain-containing protein [Klebsiella pneumoniae]
MAKQGVESVPIWSVITDLERNIAPLYRHAQPAPVVPDEKDKTVDADDHPLLWSFNEGWNACRAAMLQELKKSAGTEAICRSDENVQVLHAKSPAQSDCCPAQNGVNPEQKSLTPAQDGNHLVIPDGYVMVPEEPTESMVIAGFESEPDEFFSESEVWEAYQKMSGCEQAAFRARLCWRAMLAVAPQSPGSEPATVPGKWIPVSERMPEDDDFVYIWPRPDFGVELHVGQYCECSPKGDGWYAQVYEQNYGIEWHPITVTHWMPLPAAPQEVKSES